MRSKGKMSNNGGQNRKKTRRNSGTQRCVKRKKCKKLKGKGDGEGVNRVYNGDWNGPTAVICCPKFTQFPPKKIRRTYEGNSFAKINVICGSPNASVKILNFEFFLLCFFMAVMHQSPLYMSFYLQKCHRVFDNGGWCFNRRYSTT